MPTEPQGSLEVQCWRGDTTGTLVFTPYINLPDHPDERWRVHYQNVSDPLAAKAIRDLQTECGRLMELNGELEEEIDAYS